MKPLKKIIKKSRLENRDGINNKNLPQSGTGLAATGFYGATAPLPRTSETFILQKMNKKIPSQKSGRD